MKKCREHCHSDKNRSEANQHMLWKHQPQQLNIKLVLGSAVLGFRTAFFNAMVIPISATRQINPAPVTPAMTTFRRRHISAPFSDLLVFENGINAAVNAPSPKKTSERFGNLKRQRDALGHPRIPMKRHKPSPAPSEQPAGHRRDRHRAGRFQHLRHRAGV